MVTQNLILNTDSYKASHYLQYPPGTTHVSCYIECRGGEFEHCIFFGLQMFLKEYLTKSISQADIDAAEEMLHQHGLPFNRSGWEHILKKHNGFLPLAIEAVAEGTQVPVRNVMLQVVNTDPHCGWLTTYMETALLRGVWYPTTVATLSWQCKKVIRQYLLETADSLAGLPHKLHDFGARGASSAETAALGGAAHLVNFEGTDTVLGLVAAKHYYNEPMAGYSIPAAEHSTITCWGKEGESAAYANMLKQFAGPGKMVAVVSDSYDLWYALGEIWGSQLKAQVEKQGGVVIIRPDSGDPLHVVPEAIDLLIAKFGATTNQKGYRVLPDYLRIIQGDLVNLQSIKGMLAVMKARGQSAENIAFGMGGALLQKIHRDTLEFAMKASAVMINGEWCDVYKSPVTEPAKVSKRGRLALIKDEQDHFKTIPLKELGQRKNFLIPIFENGKLLQEWKFNEIRQLAESALQ